MTNLIDRLKPPRGLVRTSLAAGLLATMALAACTRSAHCEWRDSKVHRDALNSGVALIPMMRSDSGNEVIDPEPFRIIIRFPDIADQKEGVVTVDDEEKIRVAEATSPSTDGIHQIKVKMELGQLYLITGGVTLGNGGDVRGVLVTDLVASYEEGVDTEMSEQYADTPFC